MLGSVRVQLSRQQTLLGQLTRLAGVTKEQHQFNGTASPSFDQYSAASVHAGCLSVQPPTHSWPIRPSQVQQQHGYVTEIITSQPAMEPEALQPVKVAFIGAGGINFGSFEGPWNHAKHISRIPGVEVVGVSDINTRLAERRISEKQQSMFWQQPLRPCCFFARCYLPLAVCLLDSDACMSIDARQRKQQNERWLNISARCKPNVWCACANLCQSGTRHTAEAY